MMEILENRKDDGLSLQLRKAEKPPPKWITV